MCCNVGSLALKGEVVRSRFVEAFGVYGSIASGASPGRQVNVSWMILLELRCLVTREVSNDGATTSLC